MEEAGREESHLAPQQNVSVNQGREGGRAKDPLSLPSLDRSSLSLFPSHFSDLISGQYHPGWRRHHVCICIADEDDDERANTVAVQVGDRWGKVEREGMEGDRTTEQGL